jgi:integrase
VHEPATVTRELSVQVHRALPASLWTRVRQALDARCAGFNGVLPEADDEARQWRAARAANLLMGDSGLRRAEAALARREDLRLAEVAGDGRASRSPSPRSPSQPTSPPTSSRSIDSAESGRGPSSVWTLTVIGKRRKQRTVPVSGATVAALRAHWQDRGRAFDEPHAQGPLIAPQWIPATRTALERHDAQPKDAPHTVDAFGRLVRTAVQRLAKESAALADFSTDDLVQLANTSAHAFRHTFGTRAVAREMPTDVVQAILGHASLQTTSIYVRAERRRMLKAAARYYDEDVE